MFLFCSPLATKSIAVKWQNTNNECDSASRDLDGGIFLANIFCICFLLDTEVKPMMIMSIMMMMMVGVARVFGMAAIWIIVMADISVLDWQWCERLCWHRSWYDSTVDIFTSFHEYRRADGQVSRSIYPLSSLYQTVYSFLGIYSIMIAFTILLYDWKKRCTFVGMVMQSFSLSELSQSDV